MTKATNITWHETTITKEERRAQNGHGSCALWFTGLSGSGKSTIANAVSKELYRLGINSQKKTGMKIFAELEK
jgi:adenylylsulfate kinase